MTPVPKPVLNVVCVCHGTGVFSSLLAQSLRERIEKSGVKGVKVWTSQQFPTLELVQAQSGEKTVEITRRRKPRNAVFVFHPFVSKQCRREILSALPQITPVLKIKPSGDCEEYVGRVMKALSRILKTKSR